MTVRVKNAYRMLTRALSLATFTSLCACATLFAPDFVAKKRKDSAEFEKNHEGQFATIHLGDRDLHYVHLGPDKNPKLIFVHGSPGDWGAYIELLKREKLYAATKVYSVDRLGYGGSSRGGVERSLEVQARAIMPLLDLGDPSQPVILVGHSYGGPVIAKMASFGDARIKSVIILAGSVDPSLEKTKWYQIPADWKVFRWMIPEELVICNQEIRALKPELEILSNEWSKITARVTVIQGMKDDLVDPKNADFIESKMPRQQVNVVRLPNRDHFLPPYESDFIEKTIGQEREALFHSVLK